MPMDRSGTLDDTRTRNHMPVVMNSKAEQFVTAGEAAPFRVELAVY